MPNVNDLMLIFSLAVLGILALSALIGFLAGLKREIKLTVVFVVLLALVWLFLGNVSNILDATLPEFATKQIVSMLNIPGNFQSLREIIVGFAVNQFPDFADLLVNGTRTYALVMGVLEFALRMVIILAGTIVVYVLCLVIRLLSFIIGSIYKLCTIKYRRRKREEKEAKREQGLEEGVVVVKSDVYDGEVVVTVSRNPKKVYRGKRRGWAAGLGLLKGAFIILLLCTPITGLLSIVNEVEPETVDMVLDIMGGNQTTTNGKDKVANNSTDEFIDWIFDLGQAYEDGTVASIIDGSGYFLGDSLDEELFDNLFKIETGTQTIYLREEIINLIHIANILPEAYAPDKAIPIDIWALDDVKQDELIELLKDVKLLYEVFPVAIEFAGTLDIVKDVLKESNQTLDGLKNVEWSKDIPLLLDAVRAALELGDFTDESFDVLNLNDDVLREVVSNIGATTFITKLMPVAINAALYLEFVETFVGEWDGTVIDTSNIVWETDFVKLVDIYALFKELELDFDNIDINAILGDSNKTGTISDMLSILVTSDLFLDVLVPIVDVAKEFQLGNLNFEEFKDILNLVNLESEDWDSDVRNLVEMAVLVQEMGVLGEDGIDFYNYDAIRGLVEKFFELQILSDKVGDSLTPVKTLLVEAAFRQFKLFDIEGEKAFEQFSKYDRDNINWEHEKTIFLSLVDAYEEFAEYLLAQGIDLLDVANHITTLLNADETYDHLIDILDCVIDSDLVLAIMPLALNKFVTPILNQLGEDSGLDDVDNPDIFDGVTSENLTEEVYNLIYILMDAKELGVFSALGDDLDLALGAYAYNPDDDSFKSISEKLGYAPAADDLAIVDIVNRIFLSRFFEGSEGKLIRILLAVFLDVRVTKEDLYNIDYSNFERSDAKLSGGIVNALQEAQTELDILVAALNALKPILTDENFEIFKEDGSINLDYFLEYQVASDVIVALNALFSLELVEVILPEVYNQMLVADGTIPAEWAAIFDVQSNYLASKGDQSYADGLTGAQLSQDLRTILSLVQVLLDFGTLDFFNEENDVLFEEGQETFDEVFDLILQLNILKDNGHELLQLILKQFLEIEVDLQEIIDADINWKEEVLTLASIVRNVFELLSNSGISGYFKLKEVLDDPMAYLEMFLVDANLLALADIIESVGSLKTLEFLAIPLLEKYVLSEVEGLELQDGELTGAMVVEDVRSIANIIRNMGEAKLMALVKAALAEFTDLIAEADDAVIPMAHELYAEIITEIFGLNLLQVNAIKQFVFDKLDEALADFDLSVIDVTNIDFAADGELIANAYLAFFEDFHQDVFSKIYFSDILAIINGEKEITDLLGILSVDNIKALGRFGYALLDLSLLYETSVVAFDFAKGILPEDLAVILDVELAKDEIISDLKSILVIINNVVDFALPTLEEILPNLGDILEAEDILAALKGYELELDFANAAEYAAEVLNRLDNLHIINGRFVTIICAFVDQLDEEDFAGVNWQDEIDNLVAIVESVVELLQTTNLDSGKEILEFIDTLSDVEGLINNTTILNNNTLNLVVDLLDQVLDLQLLEVAYNAFFEDVMKSLVEDAELPEGFADVERYPFDSLVADAHSLVNIVRQVIAFNALEIYRSDAVIDWANTTPIETILTELFGLNFLNEFTYEILEFAGEITEIDIVNNIDVASLDFAADGLLFAEAYRILASRVLSSQDFTLNSLDSFMDMNLNIMDLLKDEYVFALLDALDVAVDASVFEVFVPAGITFIAVREMLPARICEILLIEGLTGEDYIEDIHSIIEVARAVVNLGVLDIVQSNFETIEWRNAELIPAIVETILTLNFWTNKPVEVIELILDMLGVDSYGAPIEDFDFSVENEIIVEIFAILVETLSELEIDSLDDAMNLMNNITDVEVLDVIILAVADIFYSLSESNYVKYLVAPIYKSILQDALVNGLGAFGGLANLDYYIAYPEALSDDLLSISEVLVAIEASNILEFVLDNGVFDVEGLSEIAFALEELLTLDFLLTKQDTLVNILTTSFEGLELSDGVLDLESDAHNLALVVLAVQDIFEAGLIQITTLEAGINFDFEKLFSGDQPAVEYIFEILYDFGALSFLDEGLAIAYTIIKAGVAIEPEYEFLLELGPNGTPGIVEDYNSLVYAVELIYLTRITDALFNEENISILFGQTMNEVIGIIFDLNFLQGKAGKLLEVLGAEEFISGYPVDRDADPEAYDAYWDQEYQYFVDLFNSLDELLVNWGCITLQDFVDFLNAGKLMDMNIYTDRNIGLLGTIGDSFIESIVVKLSAAVGLYIALPIVEQSLAAPLNGLVSQDDMEFVAYLYDIFSIVDIVRNVANTNVIQFILMGENLALEAEALRDPSKYAGQEAIELLFGLNYLTNKIDNIFEVLDYMMPEFGFDQVNVELLQQTALQVLSRSGKPISNIAFDGVTLGQVYADFVNLHVNHNWPQDINQFAVSDLVNELFLRFVVESVETVFDLNIVEAAFPLIKNIINKSLGQADFGFIISYILETEDALLQEDIVSIISIFEIILDNFDFENYQQAVVDFIIGNGQLDFNLTLITNSLPEIIDSLTRLNLLESLKDGRFGEVLTYVFNAFLPDFDITYVDFDALSELYDSYLENEESKIAVVRFFENIALAVGEMKYDSFADIMFALDVIEVVDIIEDEYLINNGVLNYLVDAVLVLVDSTLVEQFLFAAYDNFLSPMFAELDPSIQELLDLPVAYGDPQLLQEDLVSILSIVKDIIGLDALGFVAHERPLLFNTEVDYVANIFAKVFGLNYLANEANLTNVFSLVADMFDLNISELDVAYIAENLAADGELIGKAVSTIYNKVVGAETFPIQLLEDLDGFEFVLEDFIIQDYLYAVVEALSFITDTQLVAEVARFAYNLAEEIVPEELYFLVGQDLSRKELASDLDHIINILNKVVEMEVYNLALEEGDLSFVNIGENVSYILDQIFTTNIIGKDLALLFSGILAYVGVEDVYDELSLVDIKDDLESIYNILDIVEEILINSEFATLNTLLDYVKDLANKDILKETQIVNNENIISIINIVSELIHMNLVNALFDDIYETLVAPMFENANDEFKALVDISNYPASALVEDVQALLDVVIDFVNWGILDVVINDAEINWSDITPVESLLNTIFALNYLDIKLDSIVEFVSANIFDISAVDVEALRASFQTDAIFLSLVYEDLARYVLSTEAFPLKKLSDMENMTFELESFINEPTLKALVRAIDNLTSTQLFAEAINVAYLTAEGLVTEDLYFLIGQELTKDQLVSDVKHIVNILNKVIEMEAYNLAFEDGDLSFEGIGTNVAYILDQLFTTNIIGNDLARFFSGVLAFVGIEVSADELNHNNIKVDLNTIYSILEDVEDILINSELTTLNTLLDYIADLGNKDILKESQLVNNENIISVINIVSKLLDLSLVDSLYEPLFEAFINPIAEGLHEDIQKLLDISNYDSEMFVADMQAILEILVEFVNFGILDIIANDAEIDWENTTPIATLFENILGLNYLNVKLQDILDYVSYNIFDLTSIDADALRANFENDALFLTWAYEEVVDHILTNDAFPIHKLSDLQSFTIQLGEFINGETLHGILDALGFITDTQLFTEAIGVAFAFSKTIVPEQFAFLVNQELTKDQLASDIKDILAAAEILVNREIYNLAFVDGDIEFTGIAQSVIEILDLILNTNILGDHAYILHHVFAIFDIEISETELSKVNYADDFAALGTVLENIEAILISTEINSIGDLFDFMNSYNLFDDFENPRLLTNENLSRIILSLVQIVGLDLVSVIYEPIYEQVIATQILPNVDPMLEPFLDLSNYSAEELVNDLVGILLAINDLVEFDIIGIIYRETPIDWENTEPVTNFIETIFGLEYLADRTENIIEVINAYVFPIEPFLEYKDEIDLLNEGEILADIYCEIAGLMGDGIQVKTLGQIFSLTLKNKYFTDSNAQYIVNALEIFGASTLLEPLFKFALLMVEDMLEPELQFLAEPGSNGYAGLVDDYYSIVEILQIAIDLQLVKTIFIGHDISFDIEAELHRVIDIIFGLNYLDIDGNCKLDLLLEYLVQTNELDGVDLDAVDWHNEQALLKNIVTKAINLLKANQIYAFNDIQRYIDSVTDGDSILLGEILTDDNAYAVLDIVSDLLDSTLVLAALPFGLEMARESLDALGYGMILENIDGKDVLDDLDTIIEVARDLIEDGILPEIVEIVVDFEHANIVPALDMISNQLQKLLNLNVIVNSWEAVIEILIVELQLDDSEVDYAAITHEGETAIIVSIFKYVVLVLDHNNLDNIHEILSLVESGDFISDSRVINDFNLTIFVNIINELAKSNLVAQLFIPAYEIYVQPTIDGLAYQTVAEFLTVDYDNYSADLFKADFQTIGQLLGTLNGQGVLRVLVDVINKVDTNIVLPESYKLIVNTIFDTNFVQRNVELIAPIIAEILEIDYSEVNESVINIENDVKVVLNAIIDEVCAFLALDTVNATTIDSISNLIENYKDYVSIENGLAVLDIVDLVLDLSLIEGFIIPVLDQYVNPLLPVEFQDIYTSNPDYQASNILADVDILVDVARELVMFNALNIVLNDAEIEWAQTTNIENAIILLFSLEFIDTFDVELMDYVSDITGYELVQDVEVEAINWANDGSIVASAYKVLAKAILADGGLALNTFEEIKSFEFDLDDLMKDKYVIAALEAADIVLGTSFVNVYAYKALEIINTYVPEDFAFIIEEAEISSEKVVEDFRTIVAIADLAVKAGALDLYHEENMALNPGLYEGIIAKLFDLNLTASDDVRIRIVNLVLEMAGLEHIESVSNWDNEEQVLIDTVYAACNFLTFNNIFTLKDIELFVEAEEYLEKEFATDANVLKALDIVDELINSEIVLLVAADLYEQLVQEVPYESIQELLAFGNGARDYYEELFYVDVPQLVAIAKKAVQLGVVELYRSEDMVIPSADAINDILVDVFALGLFNNRLDLFADLVFDKYGIDVELQYVDWDSELDILYAVVDEVIAMLGDAQFTTVMEVKDYVSSIDVKALINDEVVVNEATIEHVLNIVEIVLDSEVLEITFAPVYEKVLNKLVDELGLPEAMADASRYSFGMFKLDAKSGIQMAKELLKFNVLDIYRLDAQIDWAYTLPIENIIKLGFGLEFVDEFDKELFEFVGSKLGKDLTSDVDFDAINWAADGELFAQAYVIVAEEVFASEDFFVKTYSQLRAGDFDYEALIADKYVLAVINAADIVVDSTLVNAFALKALDFVNGYVPASLQFVIAETTITSAEAVEDFHGLLDIAELAVSAGIVDFYHTRDMYINASFYNGVVDELFALNLTKDSELRIRAINAVLSRLDLEEIDSVSDWDNEQAVIKATIVEVCELLANNKVLTVKGLYNFAVNKEFMEEEFLTDENVLAVLDIAEAAIASEVVLKVSASLYSKVVEQISYASVRELLAFGNGARDYYKELFYLDAPQFIAIAKKAVGLGIVDLYHRIDVALPTAALINEILADLFATGLFNGRLDLFANVVFDRYGIEADLEHVDWDSELDILYAVVVETMEALKDANFTTVFEVKDYVSNLDMKALIKDAEVVNEDSINHVLNIFEIVLDSEVLEITFAPVYEKVMNKVVARLGLPEAMADASRYSFGMFKLDAKSGIQMAKELLKFNVLDIYRLDEQIDWAYTLPIENIIKLGFGLEFVDEFDKELFEFVGSKLGKDLTSDVDFDAINWAADGELFAQAYVIVAEEVFASEDFFVKTYSQLRARDFDYKALIADKYVLAVINAADIVVDSTLVNAFALKALDFVNGYVPASLQFVIAETTITNAEAVEDFHGLLDIAELAVSAGIVDFYHTRDMYINASFYNGVIDELFALNLTKDSELRIRAINAVLARLDLEEIDSVSDWDNEQAVIKATIVEVCEFLANNKVLTVKGLYNFAVNKEFMDKEFLTDENVLAVLDIAEAAIASEVVLKVSASVYDKVVDRIPFNGAQDVLGFGDGARDYNKELFYLDAPQFIEIARAAVELGVLDVYRIRDMVIPTSDQIIDILDDVFALGLFNDRLDLYFDLVFNKLGVTVDLSGIDWDNEIEVLYFVIEESIPVLVNGGTTTLQQTLSLLRTIRADVKGFVKNNRTYVNLENAYVGLDILEKLGTSEVYMRSLTQVVNKVATRLPGNITDYIDLTQYPENELREDYPDFIEIARQALDGRIYKVLTERRGWAFPVEAQTALETIVALGCDLHFTARYTEGMIRLVASVAGINNLPSNLGDIDLAADKPLLVSLVGMARNIWVDTNNLHPQFAMFANKALFEEIYNALDTSLDTTLFNVMLPWAYETYVGPRLTSLPIPAEYINVSKAAGYKGDEVIELFDDILAAYASALEMNVFGTSGIDFTNKAHVTNIVDLMLKHVDLHSRLENYLVRFANKSDRMGIIVVPYEEVTSTRGELSAIKGILASVRDLASNYGSALSDLGVLGSAAFENDVMALLAKIEESVLLEATFIPVVNGLADIVIGDEYYLGFTAIPVATYDEFEAEVGGLFDILQKAESLGFLNKDIKYKETLEMKAMFQMIEVSVFFNGQEGIILEFLLGKTDYVNPDEVDLVSINFANEYQYLYNFLDKAYAPLNMPGIVVGKDLINNAEFMAEMTEALEELADSQVLVEFFLPLVDIASDKYPSVKDILDYSHLDKEDPNYSTQVRDEYLRILDLLKDVSSLDILDGNMDRIHVETLLQVYDNVFALEGTQNTQDALLEKLVGKLDVLGTGVEIPADVDWDQEKVAIRALIASLSHFADAEGYAEINADTITSTTNVAGLEAILTALNNSQIYRVQLFEVLSDEIDGMGASGDLVIADFLTEWFKDQQENGMLPTSAWAQEVIYFARVLAIVNHLNNNGGISDFASIELGTMTGNAATVDTEDFEVEEYGFRQLLQLMSKSQSFTLTALNGTLDSLLIDRTIDGSGSGAIKTQKHLPELSDAEWDIEIDNLINVIANIQELGVLDSSDSMSDQLQAMEESEISDLIKSFNNSQVLRVVLPDFIYDAVKNADATDYASAWLKAQAGVDVNGINNPVAPKAEWDAEADNLAAVIKSIGDVDFANLDLNTISDEELDDLENIVGLMNNTMSFVLDPLADMINDLLEANGLEVEVLGVFDKDADGSNKDEWAAEISILFSIIEGLNDLGTITDSTITTQAPELGSLLDIMKTSYLFGNDVRGNGVVTTDDNVFNSLVIEILDTNNLFSDTSANGFIDRSTALDDDWAAYNWTAELSIISAFDTQNGADNAFITQAQSSDIIKKYFDIAGYVNDYIDSVTFTLEIIPGYEITLTLAEYVNGVTGRTDGQFVNSDFTKRIWADEINDMEALVDLFSNTSESTDFIKAVEALDVRYQAVVYPEVPTLAVHFGHLLKDDIIDSVDEVRAQFAVSYPFLPNPIPTGNDFWAAALLA